MSAVTSFETNTSVYNLSNENDSFSVTTPGHWTSKGGAETIEELQKLLELRPENDTDLHVKEVAKSGNQLLEADRKFKLSDLDSHRNEIIDELKNVEYNELADMVFRMELTYSEVEKVIDVEHIPKLSIRYTLPPGAYESSDNKFLLKSLRLDDVKITFRIDDIRMKSILTTHQTLRFTKRSFFYKFLVLNNPIQDY